MREGKGNELARRCWEEMRERLKEGKAESEWEKKREGCFERRG